MCYCFNELVYVVKKKINNDLFQLTEHFWKDINIIYQFPLRKSNLQKILISGNCMKTLDFS